MFNIEAGGMLPAETSKAFAAYNAYAELPPGERTLIGAYRRYSERPDAKSVPGQFAHWSKVHHWPARARQEDLEHARVLRERLLKRRRETLDALDNLARLILVKATQAFKALPPEKTPAYAASQMAKVAAEIGDAAWTGTAELNQTTAQETLPAEGYDVLDSLRADPGLAPLLVRLQGLGVDLEPEAEPDADDLAS